MGPAPPHRRERSPWRGDGTWGPLSPRPDAPSPSETAEGFLSPSADGDCHKRLHPLLAEEHLHAASECIEGEPVGLQGIVAIPDKLEGRFGAPHPRPRMIVRQHALIPRDHGAICGRKPNCAARVGRSRCGARFAGGSVCSQRCRRPSFTPGDRARAARSALVLDSVGLLRSR